MNTETLTRLLVTLSRNGIDYCSRSTRPPPPAADWPAFTKPFYPLQSHPIMEMIFRLHGTPAICINGHWTHYTSEKVMVFIPGTGHTEHPFNSRQSYQLLWCTILDRCLMFHLTAYSASKGYTTSIKRMALSPPTFRKVWEVSTHPGLATSAVRQAEFHYLLMESLCFCIRNEALFPSGAANAHEQVIEHLRSYIDEHYGDEITLAGLAAVFHYSPKHLNALFKTATGTPLLHYVGALRMRKARELLLSGSMLVKQAAEAVGIHDPLYFSRKFRQHFGCSPIEACHMPGNTRKRSTP